MQAQSLRHIKILRVTSQQHGAVRFTTANKPLHQGSWCSKTKFRSPTAARAECAKGLVTATNGASEGGKVEGLFWEFGPLL